MLLREEDFQHRYGPFYQQALREAQDLVARPEQLKTARASEKSGREG